ncbi:hypothetical protein FRC12_009266 [Ceratobasidium sp. 428]|nr:hypothetical protein FRC12_009266 [Ceratobasidium sp. 428]
MEVEAGERADPDVLVLPRPPPPRIPEPYRSLPADHYFVAPPAILPYPRSPSLRIDENHPLYTPASLFAHLPRAPPLSPRLDPLTILELETTREQSEWEQACQGLGRPNLGSSAAQIRSSAHVIPSRSTPQPLVAAQITVEHTPSAPVSSSTSNMDIESDADSSDGELCVHDIVAPITSLTTTVLPGPEPRTENPQIVPARGSSQSNPSSLPTSDTSNSSARPNPPAQHAQPQGLFGVVPRRTESAFGRGGTGPASSSILNGTMANSPEPTNTEPTSTTPAKRKHDSIDGSNHVSAIPSAPEQSRVGVPPPLRASVDHTPVPIPAPVPEEAATPNARTAPLASSVPTPAPTETVTQLPASSTPTPSPANVSQPGRKPCRFYNRPPGRVCVRKEQCPDLHEGPLRTPLPPSVLATSAIPAFPNPFGATSAPNSGTTTQAPNVTVPQTTRRQATAVTRPQISAASAPTTPPTTINATLEPALAPVLSRPAIAVAPVAPVAPVTAIVAPVATSAPTSVVHTAPAPAPALARRITSAGLPARPPSTTPCKYFSSKKGCARVGFCPFRHGDESSAGPSRANSGDARVGASGVLPMAPVANSSTNSQAANAQPGSGDPSRTSPGVVVKTEQESPAPKLAGRISGAQAKSRAGPPATSRRVKEEEVTLRDLGDDHAASSDRDMADGTAKDKGPILPPSLSSAPSAQAPKPVAPSNQSNVQAERRPVEPPKTPVVVRVPPSTAAPAPASRPAPAPVSASTSAPAPAPTSAPAPVPLVPSTAVIPPTPAHPPVANKTTVPQPSVAPARLPSRDSGRLDPRDRRELLTRMQDPPPRHGSRHSRSGSNTYRHSCSPRRSISRSPSPPRSRGRSPVSRGYSPRGRGYSPPRSRGHSPSRSRSRSPRRWNGALPQSSRPRGYSPRRSRSPRYDPRYARYRGSSSRSRSPDRYRRRSPSPLPRDGIPPRPASPARRWSPRYSPRALSPRSPTYRRSSLDTPSNEYRPNVEKRPAPSTRPPQSTVSREDTGYTTGHAHHPPEVNARWDHHSPLRAEPTNYEQNPRTGRDTREPIHPNHSGGPGQEPHYDPGLRAGFSVGIPQASSTPGRPPVLVESSNNPIPGLPKKPIVMPADYDNFEQSMVMETASPEARNPASSRLQERVSEYPGFVPASFVPVENTPRLYARMTQGEQLPLSERLASSETHQPMRVTYNKGPKLTNSNNNSQLAARLGVNNGERSQPLANRLQDEARSRPSYQNRDREPQARPGGGLMARMVGDKKQG